MSPLMTLSTVSMSFGSQVPLILIFQPCQRTIAPQTFQCDAWKLDILEIDVDFRSSLADAAEPAPINRNPSRDTSGSWNMLCLLIAVKMEFCEDSTNRC